MVQSSDRDGTVHQDSYDVLGRLTTDAVTTLGVGVDGTVRQIAYGYDSQGNVSLITSDNAVSGGSIVNQVQRLFNGLGQLTGEYQSHSGAVNTNSTPEVQYAYNEMSNGQNNSRLVRMTYPDGYQVFYNYNAGLDSNISRLSSLSDSSGTLESYLYLGLNTVVERDHPQSGVNLTYIQQTGDLYANSDGGDQYTGLDRFGRIIDQFWINASNGTTVDRYQYGYNADGDVLYRQNLVDTAMSELYSYDKLGQLTSFQRGTLNSSRNGIVGTPSRSQSWTPDALGNFTGVTTNSTAQTRTANQQNEYSSITGQNAPAYDADGNLTADGAGHTYVYDAWNRLVAVKNSSTGATVASYHYDGLDRLVSVMDGATLTDLYYSSSGQVVAEYSNNAWSAYNVWSAVYVNALVYRETGNQDYYALQDANWNVTAWVLGGTVMEREVYDAYGAATPLSSSWGVQGSPLKMTFGFQGMYVDWTVGLNFTRGREYSPTLMRWLQSDPIGLNAGDNYYEMENNGPTDAVDPSGLDTFWIFEPARAFQVIWDGLRDNRRETLDLQTEVNRVLLDQGMVTGKSKVKVPPPPEPEIIGGTLYPTADGVFNIVTELMRKAGYTEEQIQQLDIFINGDPTDPMVIGIAPPLGGRLRSGKPCAQGATPKGGGWVRPKGWRLPKNGTWEGTPGNSNFIPKNPSELGLNPGEVVPFRNGRPDFSKWSKGNFISKEALTGDPISDRSKMLRTVAEAKGWSLNQVEEWLKTEGLSLHHGGDNSIQLIPSQLHGNPSADPPLNGIRHMGGAYDLRQNK